MPASALLLRTRTSTTAPSTVSLFASLTGMLFARLPTPRSLETSFLPLLTRTSSPSTPFFNTRYGIKLGLTNYAACYATGLLCARRVLTKLKLADKYEGKTKVDGEDYTVEPNEKGPQPFYALLDVGLVRTTTGNRLFAALKGACDGGVEIPHSETRFVGYNHEESKLDGELLRKHLFGGHVADYMRKLSEEKPKTYAKQFSGYIAAGINPDDLEAVYSKAHAAIRKDPSFVPTKKKADQKKSFRSQAQTRLSLAERKKRVEARLAAAKAQ